jgi:hypothetical protein
VITALRISDIFFPLSRKGGDPKIFCKKWLFRKKPVSKWWTGCELYDLIKIWRANFWSF